MSDVLPFRRNGLDRGADELPADVIRVFWPEPVTLENVEDAIARAEEDRRRRDARAYLSDMHAIYGASREDLEQWNVRLALDLKDLAERVEARDALRTWAPWVAFFVAELVLITLIVFAFQPTRFHP